MKTETENLRELDVWIAEHVMGWRVFISGRGSVCCEVKGGGIRVIDTCHPWETSDFSPTTDPAAAMLVLEKCAASNAVGVQGNVSIFQEPENGRWAVFFDAAYEKHCIDPVFAETLPLAICRFAKALYSK